MSVTVEQPIVLDLLPTGDPALSTSSDIPQVETKPDSQPAPKEEKPEAKVEAAPDEGKKAAESAPAETPEEDTAANTEIEGKPKSKGVQKRIDELVRQREEEKAEKLRLLAIVEGLNKPKPEPVETEQDEPQRPSREAYTDPSAYEAALADYADQKADWSARRAVSEALAAEQRKAEVRQAEEAKKATLETYNGRVSKAVEKYPDYKQVAESPDVTVSIPMAQAILHSEHGPEIQYHLGKNPDEAKRISALPPVQQLMEVGLIVAKLTAVAPAPAVPAKPAVSNAPKPIKPLESKSGPVEKTPDEESMEEYAARRTKEIQAGRARPGVRH